MDVNRERLVERIRALLDGRPAVSERTMFGVVAFMMDGKMVVGARKGGDLLIHVDAERGAALLTQPGVKVAEMGAGRSMGPAWLEVEQNALDDEALAFWINAAVEHRLGHPNDSAGPISTTS